MLFGGGAQCIGEVEQDVVDEYAIARCVEKFPATQIKMIPGALKLLLRLEKARHMFHIDRDYEAGTAQTSAELRTHPSRSRARGHACERIEAAMSERSCGIRA
jgi:hypothetical protein